MATATAPRTFEYRVISPSGEQVTGRIEAPDRDSVAERLRETGLLATSIEEVSTAGMTRELSFGGSRIKQRDVLIMARQLATMVGAGLSILRALTVLADQTENDALTKIIRELALEVENGSSLSAALGQHGKVFPPLLRALVNAGETSGFLDQALVAAADGMEADEKLRRTIKSALTYPVMVLVIALVAVVAMLLFIVPVFQNIFESMGAELPAATRLLVGASQVLKYAGPVLAVAIGAFVWWWRQHKNDDSVRATVDPLKLKMPLLGSLMTKAAVARFTRNFSTMVRAGVPIVAALDVVGATSGNLVVEDAADRLRDRVSQGVALAEAVAEEDIFPPMVQQMIAVGEDSGSLDAMLEKVATFYDEEVTTATEQLTAIMEPLLIVVVGTIVGSMLMALYMPIFGISDAVEGAS
ncbi:MAG TPA: type II secretion system F family protein [Cellulomonas sp.]